MLTLVILIEGFWAPQNRLTAASAEKSRPPVPQKSCDNQLYGNTAICANGLIKFDNVCHFVANGLTKYGNFYHVCRWSKEIC